MWWWWNREEDSCCSNPREAPPEERDDDPAAPVVRAESFGRSTDAARARGRGELVAPAKPERCASNVERPPGSSSGPRSPPGSAGSGSEEEEE